MKTFFLIVLAGLLVLGCVMTFILYSNEVEKNKSLRAENMKTAQDARAQIEKLQAEIKSERDKGLAEVQKIVDQINEANKGREEAIAELAKLKEVLNKERELSSLATDDLSVIRQELSKIKKTNSEDVKSLEQIFTKRIRTYDTRVLSLEAQLDKAKVKLRGEAERYHYNLGVAYTQDKEFDSAVTEFKTALSYNPNNAYAHFNLGIIYDDYFKDKDNAKYHYRSFLELSPTSDDADSVREWLEGLKK